MDKFVALTVTAVLVLSVVAFRLLSLGSQTTAALGLHRFPTRWVPNRLKRWLFGDVEPKPTH